MYSLVPIYPWYILFEDLEYDTYTYYILTYSLPPLIRPCSKKKRNYPKIGGTNHYNKKYKTLKSSIPIVWALIFIRITLMTIWYTIMTMGQYSLKEHYPKRCFFVFNGTSITPFNELQDQIVWELLKRWILETNILTQFIWYLSHDYD